MKQTPLILSFVFILMFTNCEKLRFYGDTFYTVTGTIVDEANHAIPLLTIQLYAKGLKPSLGYGGRYETQQLSARGSTRTDGTFQITFPKSNGQHFLIVQNYQIIDSLETSSSCLSCIQFDIEDANDYRIDLAPVRVVLP